MENGDILGVTTDTMKEELDLKEYLNGLMTALWKTGGVPDMVTMSARKVRKKSREVKRDE